MASAPLSELTRIRLLLEAIDGLFDSGNLGKPTVKNAVLNITAGVSDSVEFSDYAGKIPIAVFGKKTSNGQFEIISPSTAGFAITAADYNDQILLINLNPSTIGAFSFQQPLSGVGTSIQFNTGTYSQAVIYYIDGSSSSANTQGMVQFTTSDGVNTYTNSSISNITTIAFVKYGQSFLASDQYSVSGNDITIAPGIPVEGGLQLLIVPFS